MQMSVPDVMDLSSETQSTIEAYGVEGGSDLEEYAKNCILARRLIEKGVRVVQLFNGSDPSGGNGITNWDSHSNILKTYVMQAETADSAPTSGSDRGYEAERLAGSYASGLATEFGRMPFLQANGTGRDHNPNAFSAA